MAPWSWFERSPLSDLRQEYRPDVEADLRQAYLATLAAKDAHIRFVEGQVKELQAKLLELTSPGVNARLEPRPSRLASGTGQWNPPAEAAQKLARPRLVPLPGHEPPPDDEADAER